MKSKLEHNLVLIENGQLNRYVLDDRLSWEIGRPSVNNYPDIMMHLATVSRKHGKFQNMDGIWFYLDYNGRNGTVYNEKKIHVGANGRIKPIMLSHGDIFIFGGGEEAAINSKTVWAMYSTKGYEDRWRAVDIRGVSHIQVTDGINTRRYENPAKGTVIDLEHGTAVYMGNLVYMIGDVTLE